MVARSCRPFDTPDRCPVFGRMPGPEARRGGAGKTRAALSPTVTTAYEPQLQAASPTLQISPTSVLTHHELLLELWVAVMS